LSVVAERVWGVWSVPDARKRKLKRVWVQGRGSAVGKRDGIQPSLIMGK